MRATICGLLAAVTAVGATYMEPMLDHAPPACGLGGLDAMMACPAQRVCEAVELDAGMPNGFGMCFHQGVGGFSGTDVAVALAVFVLTVVAASAGCGGGGLYAPVLLMAGGFVAEEAAPLVQAAVVGNAVAQTAVNALWGGAGSRVDYALAVVVLPSVVVGYLLGDFLQAAVPASVLAVLTGGLLVFALWRTWVQTRRASETPEQAGFEAQASQSLVLGSHMSEEGTVAEHPLKADPLADQLADEPEPELKAQAQAAAAAAGAGPVEGQFSDDALALAVAAFSVLVLGCTVAMREAGLCSGAHAGWAAALVAVAAAFAVLGNRLTAGAPGARVGHVRAWAFALGSAAGVAGLGAGELTALLFMELGVAPEVAAATGSYCVAWLGSCELVGTLVRVAGSPLVHWGYVAVFAVVAALGAVAAWRVRAVVADGARVVPRAQAVLLALCLVLLGAVYAAEGETSWGPAQSPCATGDMAETWASSVLEDHDMKGVAAGRLASLGLDGSGLEGSLSTGRGDGYSRVELGKGANGGVKASVTPAVFHTTATVLGRADTPVDVVQIGGQTTVHVYLAGNMTHAVLAQLGEADGGAGLVQRRGAGAQSVLEMLNLGDVLPGAAGELPFDFTDVLVNVVTDPTVRKAVDFLQDPSLEGALALLQDPTVLGALDARVAAAVRALSDPDVAGALHPTVLKAVEVLRNPDLDSALEVLREGAALGNNSALESAVVLLQDPSLDNTLALLKEPSVAALDPRIAQAVELLEGPVLGAALDVLKDPTLEGALSVLTDAAVVGNLDPKLQGVLEALRDPRLKEALAVLRNPSFDGALGLLETALDVAGVDDVRVTAALSLLREPNVKDALAVLTDPAVVGAMDPRIKGALDMLRHPAVAGMLDVLKEPSVEGAVAVLTHESVLDAADLDPRLRAALEKLRGPVVAQALDVLKDPSLGKVMDVLTASGVLDLLDERLQDAVRVLAAPSAKAALAALTDGSLLDGVDARVVAALELVQDGDAMADVLSALHGGELAGALDVLTDPSITATLDARMAEAVKLLRQPAITAALADLATAGVSAGGDTVVVKALSVLKSDAVAAALDLLREVGSTPGRGAAALSAESAVQRAVDALVAPGFLRALDLLKAEPLASAVDVLAGCKIEGRVAAVLDVVREPSVAGAMAVLQDVGIDLPVDARVMGVVGVMRNPTLAGVAEVLVSADVSDARVLAALRRLQDPTFGGALDAGVRGALDVLREPSFAGLLAVLEDASVVLPSSGPAAGAIAVLRSPALRGAMAVLEKPSLAGALAVFEDAAVAAGLDPRVVAALEVAREPSVAKAMALLRDVGMDLPLDSTVRGALGVLQDPSIGAVLDLLKDPNVAGVLDARLLGALEAIAPEVTDARVSGALAVLREPSLKTVFEVLSDPAMEVDERIVAAVGVLKDPSVTGVLDLLQDPAVAGSLDMLQDPRVQGALALARDPSVEQAMALLQDPAVVGVLDPRLQKVIAMLPAVQQALEGDFAGLLDMAPAELQPLAKFLQAPEEGLQLGGVLPLPAGSNLDMSKLLLSEDALDFELRTVAPARVPLGAGVAVDDAWFRVRASRASADAAWEVSFDVAGTFEVDLDGTQLRVPCTVSSPALGELSLTASVEAATLSLGGVDVALREVSVSGSIAVGSDGASGDLAFRASVEVEGATLGLAGAILPGTADFFLVHTAEDLSLGAMLEMTTAVLGLEADAFAHVGADWREGVVVRSLSMSVASADVEVDAFGSGAVAMLPKGFAFQVTADVRGFVGELNGTVTSTGFALSGSLLEADVAQLGPMGEHVSIDALAGELEVRWDTPAARFHVYGEVTLFSVDLDLVVAVESADAGLDLLVYAHAEPEPQVFSLSAAFPTLNGTVADEIGFASVTFVYSTEYRAEGFAGIPALAGVEIEAGFTLEAEVSGFDALATLLKSGEGLPPMPLKAVLPSPGAPVPPSVRLSLPESVGLDLGENCRAKAPVVEFYLEAPLVGVAVLFPLEVGVPGQDVLAFEAGLTLTPVDATAHATMAGYWLTPFDIEGLAIGPEVHLELSVVYATFAATGLPSAFGFRGGMQLGRIAGDVAVRVSQIPTDNVVYGRLYAADGATQAPLPDAPITPGDLVEAFAGSAPLGLARDDVPELFKVYNMDVVVAAGAGTIGSVRYAPGVTFEADVEVLGTRFYANASVGERGVQLYGSAEPFSIGPLEVKGLTGAGLVVAAELSKDAQYVEFDGAVALFGMDLGARVVMHGVSDIEFQTELSFGPAFVFTCLGRSLGDDAVEGWELRATLESNIVEWVQNKTLAGLLKLQEYVDEAEAKVNETEHEYRALYDPAYAKLEEAKQAVDELRAHLKETVYNKTEEMLAHVRAKREELEAVAKEWGDAVRAQKAKVTALQEAFEAKLKAAEAQVERARRAYNAKRAALNAKLEEAKRSLASKMSAARSKVAVAQRAADAAKASKAHHKGLLGACRWYQVSCHVSHGAKVAWYAAKEVTLRAAHGVAIGALDLVESLGQRLLSGAQKALLAIGDTVEKATFDLALTVLDDAVRGTAKQLADAARKALDNLGRTVEEWGPHGAAAKALGAAETAGREGVRVAVEALDGLAETATMAVYTSAKGALEAVEEGTVAVSFKVAKAALSATSDLISRITELGKDGKVFKLDKFELAAKVLPGQSVWEFDATLEMTIFGQEVSAVLSLRPGEIDFAQDFTDRLLKKAKDEGQKIIDAALPR